MIRVLLRRTLELERELDDSGRVAQLELVAHEGDERRDLVCLSLVHLDDGGLEEGLLDVPSDGAVGVVGFTGPEAEPFAPVAQLVCLPSCDHA